MLIKYKKWAINVNESIVDESKHNELREIYLSMYKIFEKMEQTESSSTMYNLVLELEKVEFKMQKLFGFPIDRNFHRYWLQSPGCTCGTMDNNDMYGLEFRDIDMNCPVHGKKIQQVGKRKDKLNRLLK